MTTKQLRNVIIAIWAFLFSVLIAAPLGNFAYDFYKSPTPELILFLSENLVVLGVVIFGIGCLSCLALWLFIEKHRDPSRKLRFSIKKNNGRWEIENSNKHIADAIKSVRRERQQGGHSKLSTCLSSLVNRSLLQDPGVDKWRMEQENFCNKAIDLLIFNEDVRSMLISPYDTNDDIEAIREFIAFYGSSKRLAAWDNEAREEPSLYQLATVIPPDAPDEIRLPHFKISVPINEFEIYLQVIMQHTGFGEFCVGNFSAEFRRRIVLPRALFIIINCLGEHLNISQDRIKAASLLRIADWRVRFG